MLWFVTVESQNLATCFFRGEVASYGGFTESSDEPSSHYLRLYDNESSKVFTFLSIHYPPIFASGFSLIPRI